MEPAERELLRSTVGAAVARSAEHAVDDALGRLGWLDMLASEPRDAIESVFDALGSHNATATALDDVMVAALGRQPGPDVAVLLPAFSTWTAPGQIDADRVHAVGLATSRVAAARELVIVGGDDDRRVVAVPPGDAEISPARGIDPDAGLVLVRVDTPAMAEPALEPSAWSGALAVGRRALARQIAGAGRAMLGLARTHATDRTQFGRPVAGFQAVRHRLADTLVAIEALEASVDAAWDEPGPQTAALAKAVAGRTARTVGTNCQQVLAGVGFTTDHPFHRYLKRTIVLDGLLGTADEIVLDLGRALLAGRTVPTLLEL